MYAGSILGLWWVLFAPLILMLIYASVYLFIFQVTLPGLGAYDYALMTSAGLSAFLSFGNSLGAGTNAVLKSKEVLNNAVFPAELLPVRAVLTACPPLIVGGVLVSFASPLLGQGSWKILLFPLIAFFQVLLMCGIAWILSLLTILIRDIQTLLQYVITVLLIVTPIGYSADMVPPVLSLVVDLNPLAHFVLAYQSIFVFDRIPDVQALAVIILMSTTTFMFGFWMFKKAKYAFYDYA